MRFHIKRLFIWFGRDDKPNRRVLEFENNKVNVITGSSSTGKSNILAIIDYCLLTDTPKIVYPVINELAEWYGMEFEVAGETMHIVRKKPTEEISASDLIMNAGKILDDYYPSTNNIHINDARRKLNTLFGLRQAAQRHPGIKNENGDELTLSYRSFLIYNAITEGIMSSPYLFTDINFFDSKITKSVMGQRFLFECMLGIDNVRIRELSATIERLREKQDTKRKNERKISKKTGAYTDKLNYLKTLCLKNGIKQLWENNPTDEEAIDQLKDLVARLEPSEANNGNKHLDELMAELNMKAMLLENMRRAKKEYDDFVNQLDATVDKLKPIEYLKKRFTEMGVSEWTNYILESLETSLMKLQHTDVRDSDRIVTQKAIDEMESEVVSLRERVVSLERTRELSIEKNNNLFYVVGMLKTEIPELERLKSKIPEEAEAFTPQDEANLYASMEEMNRMVSEGLQAYQRINDVFDQVYQTFRHMEYYADCKPKYNKEEMRLELNNGKSIINYNNVGSQSNYMFLHLCFFLGIHRYLTATPNETISQFLFIDQPSIPYYNGENNVKTTDEAKLKDAFSSINTFMDYVVGTCNGEFQIIMIEHAPTTYWTDLKYFKTTEEFVDGRALVPQQIINKTSV